MRQPGSSYDHPSNLHTSYPWPLLSIPSFIRSNPFVLLFIQPALRSPVGHCRSLLQASLTGK